MGMTTFAVTLDAEQAEQMRALAAELTERHIEGLAQRARSVGYARESMHLQPTEDGGALLLVHLDLEGDDLGELQRRILEYPDTEFTRWWNPQFAALMSAGPPPAEAERLFEWRDEGGAPAAS